MVAGMTGLISLVSYHLNFNNPLKILSYCMLGVFSVIFGGSRFLFDGKPQDIFIRTMALSFVAFMFLAALYSDWALGLMTDNLIGTPSKDNSAFYWTYWVAKRLTMFSV